MQIAQPADTLSGVKLKLRIATATDPPDARSPAGMLLMSAIGDLMRLIARPRFGGVFSFTDGETVCIEHERFFI